MKLPFLQDSKWPVIRDDLEEKTVNPSYDQQLQDHLIDEILVSHEKKDMGRFREAITSLIHSIKNEASDAM